MTEPPRDFPSAPRTRGQLKRFDLFMRVSTELDRAYAKHGAEPWGRHEFYAILKEEVDELWDDIKSDAPQKNVEAELTQIAAMCFRYYETGDRYRPESSDVR
jgi:NTP pyrophosphatase (non-canonical NTP hydrolase)